jgi:hypothetical protein
MILVARHQEDCVFVTIGDLNAGSYLSSIIDKDGVYQCQARARRNQALQVDDGTAVLRQERMVFVIAVCRTEAHNLTLRIDRIRPTACIASHGPEIDDGSVFPEYRVEKTCSIGPADNLAGVEVCVPDPKLLRGIPNVGNGFQTPRGTE